MTAKEPLFSIIMPNYNKARYIKTAIDSVLAQTYKNWELIIVDDASTDNSVDVIEPFLSDKRIKLIRNRDNKGVGYVARTAVEHSSGEIVGTLDSDDALHKDALKVMVEEHLKYPEYGLIYSNYYICDKNLNITGNLKLSDPYENCHSLQEAIIEKKKIVSLHFRTFKRKAYDKSEGYDVTLKCYEDRDLYYKIEKVSKIGFIDKCLYYYRQADDIGAYRSNYKNTYYMLLCEYREIKRRFKVNLPLVHREKIHPLLFNIIYLYMKRYLKINKEQFQAFFIKMGMLNLKNNNKIMSFLYFLNSYLYGYTPITLGKIKKYLL